MTKILLVSILLLAVPYENRYKFQSAKQNDNKLLSLCE